MIYYYRYLFVKMKVFNYSELHIFEGTFYKIHTLAFLIRPFLIMGYCVQFPRKLFAEIRYLFKFSLSVGDRGKTIKFQNLFFEIINISHQINFFQSVAKKVFDLIQFNQEVRSSYATQGQKNWSVLVMRTRFYFFRRKVNNFRRSLMSWFYHTNNFDKVIILTFIIFLLIIFM